MCGSGEDETCSHFFPCVLKIPRAPPAMAHCRALTPAVEGLHRGEGSAGPCTAVLPQTPTDSTSAAEVPGVRSGQAVATDVSLGLGCGYCGTRCLSISLGWIAGASCGCQSVATPNPHAAPPLAKGGGVRGPPPRLCLPPMGCVPVRYWALAAPGTGAATPAGGVGRPARWRDQEPPLLKSKMGPGAVRRCIGQRAVRRRG